MAPRLPRYLEATAFSNAVQNALLKDPHNRWALENMIFDDTIEAPDLNPSSTMTADESTANRLIRTASLEKPFMTEFQRASIPEGAKIGGRSSEIEYGLLPTAWEIHDTDVYSESRFNLKYISTAPSPQRMAVVLRANSPIPDMCGVYYYEVSISKDFQTLPRFAIGLATKEARMRRLPGNEESSWSYQNEDGLKVGGGNAVKYGPKYGCGDTIGCGFDRRNGAIFFTKNGRFLGHAFRDLECVQYYPTIGLTPSASIYTNFGQYRFQYDITSYAGAEKELVLRKLQTVDQLKHPNCVLLHFIHEYFEEAGYTKSAAAMNAEYKRCVSPGGNDRSNNYSREESSLHQLSAELRTKLMDGKIAEALSNFNSYLDFHADFPEVEFELRCQEFLEACKNRENLLPAVKLGRKLRADYGESAEHNSSLHALFKCLGSGLTDEEREKYYGPDRIVSLCLRANHALRELKGYCGETNLEMLLTRTKRRLESPETFRKTPDATFIKFTDDLL